MITDFDDLCLWTYVIVDDMPISHPYSDAPDRLPIVAIAS